VSAGVASLAKPLPDEQKLLVYTLAAMPVSTAVLLNPTSKHTKLIYNKPNSAQS
jgi:hypothetical protein